MEIYYGGYNLTDYIKVLDVKRPILSTRDNYGIDIANVNGVAYTGHKYKSKIIEVDFALICKDNSQFFTFVRLLGDILDVDVPTRLSFSDEEDKHYYAVVDGATDLDKIMSNGFGTISFLCTNPIAYSNEEKEFDINENGVISVENNGNTKTQPIINVSFTKDAHFLQVTNFNGDSILLGSVPSVDKESVVVNPTVLSEPCETTSDFTATGNVLDGNREVTGNCVVNTGGYGICCANYGEGEGWHGGALRRNIGENLDQFEVTVKLQHDSKGSLKGTGSNATTQPSNGSTYKVTASTSLRIRSGRGTKYSTKGKIPKGKTVTVTDISKNWGKVTYNKVTGYCYMKYLKKVTSKGIDEPVTLAEDSAESRQGRLEVYLFDSNSQKIGKFVMKDVFKYYEYTEPELYIGNTLILEDGLSSPKAKTTTKKDSNGKKTITKVDSGKYGKYNEFNGTFKLSRKLEGKKYVWSCEICNTENGKLVPKLTSNKLSDDNFPTGALNHIVIWFGQYKDRPVVDTMTVTDIKVKKLGSTQEEVNEPIFENGDELIIDCENNDITLNDEPFMKHLDIGSKFFNVDKGVSEFVILSDDENVDAFASITEKWI